MTGSAVMTILCWGTICACVLCLALMEMREERRDRQVERDLFEVWRREMDERAARDNVYPIRGRQVQGTPQRPPVARARGDQR